MKAMIHGRMPDTKKLMVAMRPTIWLSVALAICAGSARETMAQTQKSQLHAAFKSPVKQAMDNDETAAGDIRLAAAAQKPPVKSAKPAARKSPTLPPPKASSVQTVAPKGTEVLPEMPTKALLPLAGSTPSEGLTLKEDANGNIKILIVRDRPLSQVLSAIAQENGLNIVASNDIDAVISITLRDVPLQEALTAILAVANYTWVERNNIILITSIEEAANLPADVQGRQIQVFDLDFVAASNVSEAIQNFLSPIGKVSVAASNSTNNRLTQERIVVEDLPASLERIAQYIAQVDRPPRQVLIEAHVLQVSLDDTTRCGVNLSQLVRVHGANLNIKTTGLANSSAPQAFLATLDGADLGGVIELLETSTDAKTLGSPKLLVLNEQEARLQVGEHLGFKVTTTTETSTLENVQFLDVGVVLRIRPRISRDGSVILHVKPEVSKGAVNPDTGLPESQTAELETDVMLDDGQGMVIGGLIKENDTVVQQKVPYLGNVKGVGWLFRRSEVTKERAEIIVALVPRIQPYDCKYQNFEQGEIAKASVPLMHGPLVRNYRPWDPVLPDGKRIKYPLIPKKHGQQMAGCYPDDGPEYVIPPYPLPEQHFCDESECGCEDARKPDPTTGDPFKSDENLPQPQHATATNGSTHVISDQSAMPVRKQGGNQ